MRSIIQFRLNKQILAIASSVSAVADEQVSSVATNLIIKISPFLSIDFQPLVKSHSTDFYFLNSKNII